MTAVAACEAATAGVQTVMGEEIQITQAPLTDGGEGFCSILTHAAGGHLEYHNVCGPLGEEMEVALGWVEAADLPSDTARLIPVQQGRIAIIEMAAAAGLEQVPTEQRHPLNCTTYGVGELIRIAVAQRASAILLGIGGSATSDLGLGALEALGLRYIANNGQEMNQLKPEQWPFMDHIEGQIDLTIPPIFIACDVDNPLLGERGAAAVYGPQKGLQPAEIEPYDARSKIIARMLCEHFDQPVSVMDVPGSGAAGGISFGLKVSCGATFVPGFDLVTAWLDLKAKVAAADLILTGEGKFDTSSLAGKGPYALIKQAHDLGKQSIVFAGAVDPETASTINEQFPRCAVYSITPQGCALPKALAEGARNLDIKVSAVIHSTQFYDG